MTTLVLLLMTTFVAALCSPALSKNQQVKLTCSAPASSPITCKVGKIFSPNDIQSLNVILTETKYASVCPGGSYWLETDDAEDLVLRVPEGCDGIFVITRIGSSAPPTNTPTATPTHVATPAPTPQPLAFKSGCGKPSPLHYFRILKGQLAQPCEYPWVVFVQSIDNNVKRPCGGAIIDNRHILTAGHCVHPQRSAGESSAVLKPENIKVFTSSLNRYKPQKMREVEKVFIHERYETYQLHNDVAVLRLTEELKFDACQQPICLTDNVTVTPGRKCRVMGWGVTELYGKEPAFLRWKVDTLYDQSKCRKFFGSIWDKGALCGSPKAVCRGDSGGPLVCQDDEDNRWYQIGIVSGVKALKDDYNICHGRAKYTLVPHYVNWINEQINSSSNMSVTPQTTLTV